MQHLKKPSTQIEQRKHLSVYHCIVYPSPYYIFDIFKFVSLFSFLSRSLCFLCSERIFGHNLRGFSAKPFRFGSSLNFYINPSTEKSTINILYHIHHCPHIFWYTIIIISICSMLGGGKCFPSILELGEIWIVTRLQTGRQIDFRYSILSQIFDIVTKYLILSQIFNIVTNIWYCHKTYDMTYVRRQQTCQRSIEVVGNLSLTCLWNNCNDICDSLGGTCLCCCNCLI